MTIRSTLRTIFIGSENSDKPKVDEVKWSDLTQKQRDSFAFFTSLAGLGFAFATAVAIDEIKSTPEGCSAVLFPEQTFIAQPKHCKRDYTTHPLFSFGR